MQEEKDTFTDILTIFFGISIITKHLIWHYLILITKNKYIYTFITLAANKFENL